LQDDVTRHFEDEIAPEKHADGKAEVTGRQAEVATHGEPGEADIDAVDIGEYVTNYRKRQQAQIDLAHGRTFERAVHCFPFQDFTANRAYVDVSDTLMVTRRAGSVSA
jgi:hypothetical protein